MEKEVGGGLGSDTIDVKSLERLLVAIETCHHIAHGLGQVLPSPRTLPHCSMTDVCDLPLLDASYQVEDATFESAHVLVLTAVNVNYLGFLSVYVAHEMPSNSPSYCKAEV